MKKIKSFLRTWIAGASIVGFLFGWVMFAHSSKPASISSNLTASQASTVLTTTGSQSLIPLAQSQTSVQTRLRTGGS